MNPVGVLRPNPETPRPNPLKGRGEPTHAAFAPVTNLLALWEFAGADKEAAVKELRVVNRADKLAGRAVWVCIGNRDDCVSTDDAIAFTRRVALASPDPSKVGAVELHVLPTVGHRIHDTAHEEAAAWVRKTLVSDGAGKE